MKNRKTKALCGILAASVMMTGLSGCGSFDGTKTAIVVNGEEMTAGEANFMLRYQQASMYSYYTSLFSMYGMTVPEDFFSDEGEDNKTNGENLKSDTLEFIEKAVLMRQHAEEYGVTLTKEQQQGAADAAAAFAEKNGEEMLTLLGATKEDIQDAIELYAYQSLMYDPMVADVDTEVSDEEAKKSTISYAMITFKSSETDDDGNKLDVSDEEKAERKQMVEDFIDRVKESDDPSTVSFTDVEEEMEAENGDTEDTEEEETKVSLTISTVTFAPDEEDLDEALLSAAAELEDGEFYDGIIEGKNAYYAIRMDAVIDREATDNQKETIVSERRDDAYNDLLDSWIEESSISVKSVWKSLTVKDKDVYMITVDSAEGDTAGSGENTGSPDESAESDSTADDGSEGNSTSDVSEESEGE